MSEENIELARRAFQAFEEREMATIEKLCHPDVEFDWSRRLIDPVVVHGYEGIKGFFDEIDGIFDEISFQEEEILGLGDQVLIVSRGRFRGRSSGIDVTARAALVWTIRDGKLSRYRFYQSKEDALKDLGVEDPSLPGEPERTR